jgi:hypothetical protein
MPPSKQSEVFLAHLSLNPGKPIPIDLMSVAPVDNTRNTVWAFLSVAYGWIAHADIHTEHLR